MNKKEMQPFLTKEEVIKRFGDCTYSQEFNSDELGGYCWFYTFKFSDYTVFITQWFEDEMYHFITNIYHANNRVIGFDRYSLSDLLDKIQEYTKV